MEFAMMFIASSVRIPYVERACVIRVLGPVTESPFTLCIVSFT